MKYQLDQFYFGLEKLNIKLSEDQVGQFLTFYEMLIEKNKVMNLTTITEFQDVVQKHFIDSLSICLKVDLNQNIQILDLGTGAGFPGIPLKIAFPELNIVLIDSLNKRIIFLQEVISKLQLKKITAVHGRAEELARKPQWKSRGYCKKETI